MSCKLFVSCLRKTGNEDLWNLLCYTGPPGPPGDTGARGAIGVVGDTGPTGATI